MEGKIERRGVVKLTGVVGCRRIGLIKVIQWMGCELWNVVPNDRVECSETVSDKSTVYHRYLHSHVYQCVY